MRVLISVLGLALLVPSTQAAYWPDDAELLAIPEAPMTLAAASNPNNNPAPSAPAAPSSPNFTYDTYSTPNSNWSTWSYTQPLGTPAPTTQWGTYGFDPNNNGQWQYNTWSAPNFYGNSWNRSWSWGNSTPWGNGMNWNWGNFQPWGKSWSWGNSQPWNWGWGNSQPWGWGNTQPWGGGFQPWGNMWNWNTFQPWGTWNGAQLRPNPITQPLPTSTIPETTSFNDFNDLVPATINTNSAYPLAAAVTAIPLVPLYTEQQAKQYYASTNTYTAPVAYSAPVPPVMPEQYTYPTDIEALNQAQWNSQNWGNPAAAATVLAPAVVNPYNYYASPMAPLAPLPPTMPEPMAAPVAPEYTGELFAPVELL